jgi:hypothetical protein
MKIQCIVNRLGTNHNKVKILQRLPLDLQAREANYGVEILLKHCCDKGSTNGIKPIGAPKI